MNTASRRPSRRTLGVVAGLFVGVLSLMAARPSAAQISDLALGDRVVAAVHRCPAIGIFDDVSVGVSDRNVTIRGWVTDASKRDDIGRRAGQVDGIRSMVNAIGVLPMTTADVTLRMRVARAIYGNPAFWRYGSSTNPPIHIVVSHGHVTLTGAVGDDTEKSFAFALAHVAGAQTVANDLRVDRN
jgi:osmotically-inducible protein OsmY